MGRQAAVQAEAVKDMIYYCYCGHSDGDHNLLQEHCEIFGCDCLTFRRDVDEEDEEADL